MIRVGLLGSNGRMGQQVQAVLGESSFLKRARLEIRFVRGMDFQILQFCDAIIDFSSPEATLQALNSLQAQGKPPVYICGTTGWTQDQKRDLEFYAQKHPCLIASNFSTGVLALSKLIESAIQLPELQGYAVRIREIHHVHKKDAPSGTALSLKKILTPEAPIESIREGEVIGTHEVIFESSSDRIVLTHEASDRSIFARGAVEAAIRLAEAEKNGVSLPKRPLELRDVFHSETLTKSVAKQSVNLL